MFYFDVILTFSVVSLPVSFLSLTVHTFGVWGLCHLNWQDPLIFLLLGYCFYLLPVVDLDAALKRTKNDISGLGLVL
jgi:hypothetical protein